ncbi:MAG: hypothetical protein J7619_01245 [Dyadobacter sp.]|uniref:hypothetical protein n=1 Tax=Dyadobacter sp. TaxID=1914288 RepID=UPI001B187485|nr:hypothetical protein [Dyadobacter sp.]MBO9611284.1 hypothetical protein [Dyadobacter sp.]
MKTKQLLSSIVTLKTRYAAIIGIVTLLASPGAFAQVKIGTNPTTIEPNSNLEVEASTAGRKMKVDKTTGQVTITDGTQGAGKVFTSDANGGGSWQQVPGQTTEVMLSVNGSQSIGGVITAFDFANARYDRGGNFNLTTNVFTAPTAGLYLFNVSDNVGNDLSNAYVAWGRLNRTGNAGLLEAGDFNMALAAGIGGTGTITTMVYLNAGQGVVYEVSSNVGNVPRTRNVILQITKLSN